MYNVLLITQRNGTCPPLNVFVGYSITEMKCVDIPGHTTEKGPRLHCIRIIYCEKTWRCSVTSFFRVIGNGSNLFTVGNAHCTFKCLDDERKWPQINSLRSHDEKARKSVYRSQQREEVEGGDNKWKSARSTLEVRKNTIFFIEKY